MTAALYISHLQTSAKFTRMGVEDMTDIGMTELELLDAIQKEIAGGVKDYQSLPPEFKHDIEHFGTPRLSEAVAEKLPDFNFAVAARYLKKHWLEVTCNLCGAHYSFNMTEGIPHGCKQCNRNTEGTSFNVPKMAEWLESNYKFKYILEMETLDIYDEELGIWTKFAEEFINTELYRVVHDARITPQVANKVIAKIKADNTVHIDAFSFEAILKEGDNILINMRNGIYSVKERRLLPHDADRGFMRCIPIIYNPSAVPKLIPKFFYEISCTKQGIGQPATPHLDRYIQLYEDVAWILMPENNFQKIGLMWGGGLNGKDVFHHVLRHIVGIDNCSSVNLYQITEARFTPAQLFGSMLNTAGEVEYSRPLVNTGIIKQLRGESSITVEFKGKPPFQMVWQGKCFFNANKFPKSPDNTVGFYRTWLIQKFENEFSTERKNIDTHLKDKLVTDEELSGLFNVVVDCFLPFLMNRDDFTFSMTIEEISDLYKRKSDSVQVFVEDRVVIDAEAMISKPDMRKEYETFVKREGLMLDSDKGFKQTLDRLAIPYGEKQVDGVRYWKGIRVKREDERVDADEPEPAQIPDDPQEFLCYYLSKQSTKLSNNSINTINSLFAICGKQMDIEKLKEYRENAINPVNPVISEMAGNAIKPVKSVNSPSPSNELNGKTANNVINANPSSPGQPPAQAAPIRLEDLKTALAVHGLLLGHNFEFAPERYRTELGSMAKVGIIFEPKAGHWRYAQSRHNDGDED